MQFLRKIIALSIFFSAVYWLGQSFVKYYGQIQNWQPTGTECLILLSCGMLYAANSFFLSAGWWNILSLQGVSFENKRIIHGIYSRTQIAKYLPGNIFHFAGRHTLAKAVGINHAILIRSTLYESLGVLLTSGLVSLSGIFFYSKSGFEALPLNNTLSHWIIGIGIIGLLLLASTKIIRKLGLVMNEHSYLPFWQACLNYLAFFLVFGIIAYIVVSTIQFQSPTLSSITLIISAFSFAWVTGYITPGAPAGLGVREITLVMLLNPLLGEFNSLLSALLFRLVTISGDFLFFLLSFLMPIKLENQTS